jgi:hypothetical protein
MYTTVRIPGPITEIRIKDLLTIKLDITTQNQWVCQLCPSYRILNIRKHNVLIFLLLHKKNCPVFEVSAF